MKTRSRMRSGPGPVSINQTATVCATLVPLTRSKCNGRSRPVADHDRGVARDQRKSELWPPSPVAEKNRLISRGANGELWRSKMRSLTPSPLRSPPATDRPSSSLGVVHVACGSDREPEIVAECLRRDDRIRLGGIDGIGERAVEKIGAAGKAGDGIVDGAPMIRSSLPSPLTSPAGATRHPKSSSALSPVIMMSARGRGLRVQV